MITHKIYMYTAKDATVTTSDEIKITIKDDKKRIEVICKELVNTFSIPNNIESVTYTVIDYIDKNDNKIALLIGGNIKDLTIN